MIIVYNLWLVDENFDALIMLLIVFKNMGERKNGVSNIGNDTKSNVVV